MDDSGLRCPSCDYNLTGAPGPRCPECGWRIGPVRLDPLEAAYGPEGATFTVAVLERLGPDRVDVHWNPETHGIPAKLEALVDATWRERLALASRTGQRLFNGPMARVTGWRFQDGRLRLDVGPTDYRRFAGTNLYNAHRAADFGIASFANPLGTSAVVITRDGRLLFGRRRRQMAFHGGYLHPAGGTLEPGDKGPAGRLDVFVSMRRELREELHIKDDEIAEIVCTGLIRDRSIHQPEMVFDVSLTLACEDLLARFDPDEPEQEHTALEHCHDDPETIAPFIAGAAPITPVAVGALLLHGCHDWGRDWYESTCYAIFGELPVGIVNSG